MNTPSAAGSGSLYLCLCMLLAHGGGGGDIGNAKNLKTGINRHIRSLAFYDGSGMGIFFAVGIPIDIPDRSISLSFYFEANYQLPHINNSGQINASKYFIQKRSLDRQILYDSIENQFDSYGYRGRACLQRTICESAKFPFAHSGLVGDLVRIIFTPPNFDDANGAEEVKYEIRLDDIPEFRSHESGAFFTSRHTPSTSLNENLEPGIEQAEFADDCLKFEQECSISLLDLISHSHKDDSL